MEEDEDEDNEWNVIMSLTSPPNIIVNFINQMLL